MHYSKRIERSAEKRAFIMKKKLLSVVLTAVMAATVLTGCGSTDNGTASTTAGSACLLYTSTLRGAAGGALLCAELLKAQGYITKK